MTTTELLRHAGSVAVLLLATACSNRSRNASNVEPPPPPGDPVLEFVVGPTPTRAGVPFPEMRVAAKDGHGQPAPSTQVTLELVPPDQGAQLLGTRTRSTVDGVAVFADIAIDRGGTFRLSAVAEGFEAVDSDPVQVLSAPLHVVLMVADGWGYKQIEAAERYTKRESPWVTFAAHAMATFDLTVQEAHLGVGYDPVQAWSSLAYPIAIATDSASSATAMYTGSKTYSGRVSSSSAGVRLAALPERAAAQDLAVGAVTSVPISHATPAAWLAHNESRYNYFALADEMLWGDPATTGNTGVDPRYGGSLGPSTVVPVVLLGGGHPGWAGESYLRHAMRDKLASATEPGAWTFIERRSGEEDGGARLLAAAESATVERLCGLFGGPGGNLEFRRADGSSASRENPTLAEMTTAALRVLQRRSAGFVLMVEGGAIDYAGHAMDLDASIGETIDFMDSVRAVVDWVAAPDDGIDWTNTLLVVTGDHETGYLAASPESFSDAPLGEVSARTLALERLQNSGLRASWEDLDSDGEIDANEQVYWAWHTPAHSNSLIPLFAHGRGADAFASKHVGTDPVRGPWIDNTAVYEVLAELLAAPR